MALKSDINPEGFVCVWVNLCVGKVCASVCLSASRSWEHWWLRGRLAVGCWTDNFLVIIIMETTELWIHRATRPVLHAAAITKLCQTKESTCLRETRLRGIFSRSSLDTETQHTVHSQKCQGLLSLTISAYILVHGTDLVSQKTSRCLGLNPTLDMTHSWNSEEEKSGAMLVRNNSLWRMISPVWEEKLLHVH